MSRSADGRDPISHPGVEIIPSIPWGRRGPNMGRDPVVSWAEHRHDPGMKVVWRFHEPSGEMRVFAGCGLPTKTAFDYALAEYRQLWGKEKVKAVVMWVCQENFRENYAPLTAHQGFERHMDRERGDGLFVLVRKAKQWR